MNADLFIHVHLPIACLFYAEEWTCLS